MTHDISQIGRRGLLGFAAALAVASPLRSASAQAAVDSSPTAPVAQLDDALIAAMKASSGTSFEDRYRALAPVIEQVFNLDAVLAASIGLSWARLSDAQKADLTTAFRRYTISSYVSNFDSYNGQSFQVAPSVRTIGNGEVVVQTRLIRPNDPPIKLDYVMRSFPTGWQVVDVLTDGSISRVAVQRSDFRELLTSGGVPALTEGLSRKVASLSGSISG